MKRWVSMGLVVACVAALGYGMGRQKRDAEARQTPARGSSASHSPERIHTRTIERIVERVAPPDPEREVASGGTSGIEEAAEAPERLSFAERVADDERRQAELYQSLDTRFAGQTIDTAWRRQTEGNLSAAFSAVGSDQVRVDAVECRSDMCVSQLAHDDPRPARSVLIAFAEQVLPDLEHHIRYEDGLTTIYSLRAEARSE